MSDLKNLKVKFEEREEQCPKLQEALFERLSSMLYSSIDKNINVVVLEQTKVLGEMSKQMALLAQSHDLLTQKVSELSNRTITIKNPSDNGQRRRVTDLVETE